MSAISRNDLKNLWINGYVPTQSDYDTLFDSVYTKLDDIISSGGGISSVTYATLYTLANNSGLTAGEYYSISDFQTIHVIPETTDINSGTTESLVILATSNNTFDKQVYSKLFPNDLIFYNFFDNVCEDNTTTRKGKITYRKDTIKNISTYYDWRNVKFRRWLVDCSVTWTSGNTYNQNDLVKYNNVIYNVITNNLTTGSTISPDNDNTNFVQFLDLSVTQFWSWTSTVSSWAIGNINMYNNTNLVISASTYQDLYTFDDLSQVGNFELDNVNYYDTGYYYNNIVFLNCDICYNNKIGSSSYNCTINGNYFNYNTIGNNFNYNTIGNGFNSNTIGYNFGYNTIGHDFNSNTIGYYFNSNTIGNNFGYNTIENNFYSNTIGNNFGYNTIGNDFNSNTIGNGFKYNTAQDGVQNIDFTSATHVYNRYNATIYMGNDAKCYLEYSNNGVLTTYNVTNKIETVNLAGAIIGSGLTFLNGVLSSTGSSSGTSSASIISDTYSNIYTLANNSGLTAGNYYLINDFQTIHVIPETTDINSGTTEQLVILATSNSTFDKQVYSKLFPNDIIYYNFFDNVCENYTTPRKGKITYRKDTIQNISTYYDWRNVKFRRWKVGCNVTWSSGVTYNKGDLVIYNNIIYLALNTQSGTITPNLNIKNYIIFLDISSESYISCYSDVYKFSNKLYILNNYNYNNLSISANTYNDYYTFKMSNLLNNNDLNIDDVNFSDSGYYYNNIVFTDAYSINNVNIKNESYYCTITSNSYIYNLEFGIGFIYNILISENLHNNTINNCSNTIFNKNLTYNTINIMNQVINSNEFTYCDLKNLNSIYSINNSQSIVGYDINNYHNIMGTVNMYQMSIKFNKTINSGSTKQSNSIIQYVPPFNNNFKLNISAVGYNTQSANTAMATYNYEYLVSMNNNIFNLNNSVCNSTDDINININSISFSIDFNNNIITITPNFNIMVDLEITILDFPKIK